MDKKCLFTPEEVQLARQKEVEDLKKSLWTSERMQTTQRKKIVREYVVLPKKGKEEVFKTLDALYDHVLRVFPMGGWRRGFVCVSRE